MTTNERGIGWVEELGAERASLGRASTARRVADVLRARITEGRLPPGTRLSEEDIGAALGVSRNTLRESFRLLAHERLLVHEFNRGVFVRKLDADDVRDLYAFRRILECGALRHATRTDEAVRRTAVEAVRRAVEDGESSATQGNWVDVGTANMAFHQAIALFAQSPRVDEAMRHVLAELRLVFHVMAAPQTFHEPYLTDNRRILGHLADGEFEAAAQALAAYLDAAESQLVAVFE
ncbi:GntR family transcriptional regulator [Nocardioides sp. Root140]|uniref:GntR family transcriptional regulator n=1 Tax=Nocardioides sp. Root140 TaxID=1736460 RepID=UPI0006F47CA3|nr:GntR family transcriptional regulator [Nocardioides sp. Root140]KQY57301.1 GntR family transcriptional regulator [Nocardioides sp. Root140]